MFYFQKFFRWLQIERAFRQLQQKFHAERWSDRWSEDAGEYGLYYNEKRKKSKEPAVELDIKVSDAEPYLK